MLDRFRLVLHPCHQPLIFGLLGMILILVAGVFLFQYWSSSNIVDIDQAPLKTAQIKIDINSAEWPELVVIGGIGESRAKAIVDYRQQNGPFPDIESLQDVPGIGPGRLSQMKPYLLPVSSIDESQNRHQLPADVQ